MPNENIAAGTKLTLMMRTAGGPLEPLRPISAPEAVSGEEQAELEATVWGVELALKASEWQAATQLRLRELRVGRVDKMTS